MSTHLREGDTGVAFGVTPRPQLYLLLWDCQIGKLKRKAIHLPKVASQKTVIKQMVHNYGKIWLIWESEFDLEQVLCILMYILSDQLDKF